MLLPLPISSCPLSLLCFCSFFLQNALEEFCSLKFTERIPAEPQQRASRSFPGTTDALARPCLRGAGRGARWLSPRFPTRNLTPPNSHISNNELLLRHLFFPPCFFSDTLQFPHPPGILSTSSEGTSSGDGEAGNQQGREEDPLLPLKKNFFNKARGWERTPHPNSSP